MGAEARSAVEGEMKRGSGQDFMRSSGKTSGRAAKQVPTPKERVLSVIKGMPDEASMAEILHEIYLQGKVRRGLQELESGAGISHREVRRLAKLWADQ